MPKFFSWFGLEAAEDPEAYEELGRFVTRNGTPLWGYYGFPYVNCHLGQLQLIMQMEEMEGDSSTVVTDLDTHGHGESIWNVYTNGVDYTPTLEGKLAKRIGVFSQDGKDFAVVNLVNADVLPSYLSEEQIQMQMLAFPVSFDYFADEAAFFEVLREKGKPLRLDNIIKDGQIVPVAYMEGSELERDHPKADHMVMRATVKYFSIGDVEIGDDKVTKYVRCFVDTVFGELEIVHSADQVPQEQLAYMQTGAIIAGIFVLSGDVAIHEYAEGIVHDHEHNLKLLQAVIQRDGARRLKGVLADDARYISSAGETYTGEDEIINRFRVVKEEGPPCMAWPGTVVSVDEDADSVESSYAIGTRCLVLSYGEYDEHYGNVVVFSVDKDACRASTIDPLIFVEEDEHGYISQIHTTRGDQYRVKLDDAEKYVPEDKEQEGKGRLTTRIIRFC